MTTKLTNYAKTQRHLIRRSMREAAELLERAGKHRTCGQYGICHLFSKARLDAEHFSRIAQLWPKHSTNFFYPVPSPTYPNSWVQAKAIFDTIPSWSGEYGKLRRELCLFVAARIRGALKVNELIDFRGSNWR
jgi:hypothetical protein